LAGNAETVFFYTVKNKCHIDNNKFLIDADTILSAWCSYLQTNTDINEQLN